jgi:hypothetical protein
VAVSWWLAIALVDRRSLQEVASFHATEEAIYQLQARAPIPPFYAEWAMDRDRRCSYLKRALSEPELMRERQVREQAARLAEYHRSLKIKYTWLAWLPGFPVAADPPPPE